MFRYKLEILIFFIVLLKVCNAKPLANTTQIQAQTQTQHFRDKPREAGVSSYFRQDPYGPNTYAFGFEVDDRKSHNMQFRDERRYLNGTIVGSYGYVRPDGRITLTRYLADKEHGYHTHTDLFQPGEAKKVAAARWPTFVTTPKVSSNVSEDHHDHQQDHQQDHHHNLTKEVIQAVKEKHGIDLSEKDLSKSVQLHHDPTIADIVNGEIPLSILGDANKSNVVGFETVNKFIPDDFPIVPFELPTHLEQSTEHVEDTAAHVGQTVAHVEELVPHVEKTTALPNKYEQAKQNNAEKALPKDLLKTREIKGNNHTEVTTPKPNKIVENEQSTMLESVKSLDQHESSDHDSPLITPKPLVGENNEKSANATWYRKVINEARKEFLQNLPSLQ